MNPSLQTAPYVLNLALPSSHQIFLLIFFKQIKNFQTSNCMRWNANRLFTPAPVRWAHFFFRFHVLVKIKNWKCHAMPPCPALFFHLEKTDRFRSDKVMIFVPKSYDEPCKFTAFPRMTASTLCLQLPWFPEPINNTMSEACHVTCRKLYYGVTKLRLTTVTDVTEGYINLPPRRRRLASRLHRTRRTRLPYRCCPVLPLPLPC